MKKYILFSLHLRLNVILYNVYRYFYLKGVFVLGKYVVAGFKVEMSPIYDMLKSRAEKYRADFVGEPDIKIEYTQDSINRVKAAEPSVSDTDAEYLLSGVCFNHFLLSFGGFTLHSSAVCYKNKAYLFSADCGTGKSTHTALWIKNVDGAFYLNDDKPIITQMDGKFYASGTPWCGKNDINENITVELGGIVFLERSTTPFIEKANSLFAINSIIKQTKLPSDKALSDTFLNTLDSLLKVVPTYRFGADISKNSLKISFEALTGDKLN